MKIGEIWLEKKSKYTDVDEEAIKITKYIKDDLWYVQTGCIENEVFESDEDDDIYIYSGKKIYKYFYKYGEA
jgi:hypothetical protein